jgi:hypothetical protein
MTLEDLHASWAQDSTIDENKLDISSIEGAKMHAKYLELYGVYKLRMKKKEYELALLKKDKWLYYAGKMSKAEMDKRNWPYDPYNGNSKPLKSELDIYIENDEDIAKLKLLIEYQKTFVDTCKEILDTLRWRHTVIKNILDHRRFISGV